MHILGRTGILIELMNYCSFDIEPSVLMCVEITDAPKL